MSRERSKRATLPPAEENIAKLQKVINGGDFYGAQQMYKSFSARYLSAERYSEALDILQSGACIQLENGQVTCGAELAVLFVEALVKGTCTCNEDTLDRVRKIYKKFPQIPVPQHLDLADDDDIQQLSEALAAAKVRVEACSSFLKAAINFILGGLQNLEHVRVDLQNFMICLLSTYIQNLLRWTWLKFLFILFAGKVQRTLLQL